MYDFNESGCSVVSASKLERDMGISKSYRQKMTKLGLFKARKIPGSRKIFYNTCQIKEAIFGPSEKPKSEFKKKIKEIAASAQLSSESKQP